jgi:hypothetical protein
MLAGQTLGSTPLGSFADAPASGSVALVGSSSVRLSLVGATLALVSLLGSTSVRDSHAASQLLAVGLSGSSGVRGSSSGSTIAVASLSGSSSVGTSESVSTASSVALIGSTSVRFGESASTLAAVTLSGSSSTYTQDSLGFQLVNVPVALTGSDAIYSSARGTISLSGWTSFGSCSVHTFSSSLIGDQKLLTGSGSVSTDSGSAILTLETHSGLSAVEQMIRSGMLEMLPLFGENVIIIGNPVRAIVDDDGASESTELAGYRMQNAASLYVRRSDVPVAPREGDPILFRGKEWRVDRISVDSISFEIKVVFHK